jgi:hypothetical protein
MYVYILFTRLGYVLEVHPHVPGTSKHPDYLARKNDQSLFIEVKHLEMLSETAKGLERRQNTLLDSINKVSAINFLVKIDKIIFKDHSQPSGKKIVQGINKYLTNLDPDTYSTLLEKHGFDGVPIATYEDDKVCMHYQALPKSPLYRGTHSRAIASFPPELIIGNDSDNIQAAVEEKALRYGELKAPFIICLNKQSVGLDGIEIGEALYGKLETWWSGEPPNQQTGTRWNGQGAFGSDTNQKLTRLSAVYVSNCNTANLASTAEHTLRRNFFAKYPANGFLFETINKTSTKVLLGIADDYPGKQLPFLKIDP